MKISVEYYAQARVAAGVGSEVIETPPCTAHELAMKLARAHGGRLATLMLTADGRLSSAVLLAVGDRQVKADEPLPLCDGDELIVMPAVSGG